VGLHQVTGRWQKGGAFETTPSNYSIRREVPQPKVRSGLSSHPPA